MGTKKNEKRTMTKEEKKELEMMLKELSETITEAYENGLIEIVSPFKKNRHGKFKAIHLSNDELTILANLQYGDCDELYIGRDDKLGELYIRNGDHIFNEFDEFYGHLFEDIETGDEIRVDALVGDFDND